MSLENVYSIDDIEKSAYTTVGVDDIEIDFEGKTERAIFASKLEHAAEEYRFELAGRKQSLLNIKRGMEGTFLAVAAGFILFLFLYLNSTDTTSRVFVCFLAGGVLALTADRLIYAVFQLIDYFISTNQLKLKKFPAMSIADRITYCEEKAAELESAAKRFRSDDKTISTKSFNPFYKNDDDVGTEVMESYQNNEMLFHVIPFALGVLTTVMIVLNSMV